MTKLPHKGIASAASKEDEKASRLIADCIEKDLEMAGFYQYICDTVPDISIDGKWRLLNRVRTLRDAMTFDGVVKFAYNNVIGGEEAFVIAYGTRDVSILDHYPHRYPRKRKSPGSDGSFLYYNLEKERWCCFNILYFTDLDCNYTI